MSFDKSGRFYYLNLIRNRLRHGLILFTLRNVLMRLGLNISPYYWVQEGLNNIEEPKIKGNPEDYPISYFDRNDILEISKTKTAYKPEVLLNEYDKGKKCIGIKYDGEIAAFMFIQFDDVNIYKRTFELKNNEAYLELMYTYNEFRGRNLAPYLRYCCYELLRKEKKNNLYSISAYFNRPAQKFKKKLNAKNLALYVYIEVFRFSWDFVLRKY